MRTPYRALIVGVLMSIIGVAPSAALEVQGHRGARGLWPENTLAGFAGALRLGVDVLELDVALTADDVVVVTHDPRLNPDLTRGPGGQWLPGVGPAIRSLPLAGLRGYDIGRVDPSSRYGARYTEQQAVDGQRIPTLLEVFELAGSMSKTVRFNIEIKIQPNIEDDYPEPEHFARRVVETIKEAGMLDRVIIQGFDWRPLRQVSQLAPDIPIAALTAERPWLDNIQRGQPGASPWTAGLDVDDFDGSVPAMVAKSGAGIWSPYYRDVNASSIAVAQGKGLRVIVWTVNTADAMEQMINLGVDGIITDYPGRLRSTLSSRKLPLPDQAK
jgi:glycerophosphoryl diester phosphodiesterase